MSEYPRTRSAPLHLALVGVLIAATGCGPITSTRALAPEPGRGVLSQDQIPYGSAETAYDIVTRLRPEFFISTAGRSLAAERLVYVNGLRVGGMEVLRGIPAGRIQEIQLLSPYEAARQLGGGHDAGALMIKLRRGWQPAF